MDHINIRRRTFLKVAGAAAVTVFGAVRPEDSSAEVQIVVPNSAGTERPRLRAPANACDCHHHIFDAIRFPPAQPGGQFTPNARVEEYRMLQRRIGTTRNVVVTPAPYVGNNGITLDALARFGANARGVAVVRPDVSDKELRVLAGGGIRGVRLSFANPAVTYGSVEMIEPMAKRVNDLGWHVQLFMRGDQIVAAADMLNRIPTPIVFDHMGVLPQPDGANHPAFNVIRRLVDKGRTWVKLSGAYIEAKSGFSGEVALSYTTNYAAASKVAQAYVKVAPERVVWGSDWPHPSLSAAQKPDDAVLFDLLAEWAPDAATRHRILVENPETLYGFSKSS